VKIRKSSKITKFYKNAPEPQNFDGQATLDLCFPSFSTLSPFKTSNRSIGYPLN